MAFWDNWSKPRKVVTSVVVIGALLAAYGGISDRIKKAVHEHQEASKNKIVMAIYDSSDVIQKHLQYAYDVLSKDNPTFDELHKARDRMMIVEGFLAGVDHGELKGLVAKGWIGPEDPEAARGMLTEAREVSKELLTKEAVIRSHMP